MAVLVPYDVATREERDRIASDALRRATGKADITIARRPSGRPRLELPYPELGVSLSRRGGLLLAGFSPDATIGVDIELPGAGIDPVRLATDHFTTSEGQAVATASTSAAALDLFLRLWVAKEAALKATGRGIFDNVEEPSFAAYLDSLGRDGAVFQRPSSVGIPSLHMSVARIVHDRDQTVYCALAVLDA